MALEGICSLSFIASSTLQQGELATRFNTVYVFNALSKIKGCCGILGRTTRRRVKTVAQSCVSGCKLAPARQIRSAESASVTFLPSITSAASYNPASSRLLRLTLQAQDRFIYIKMPPPPRKPAEQPAKNERNEYIPSFISKKPFYIDDATASEDDYLEHQRLQNAKNSDPLATSKWYSRGQRAGPAATKYRKGACENCGSMTHKTKECLYRTRKAGAKWTGKDIQADEVVQDVKLGWDAKRDRWNGYDANEYNEVVEEYNALEAMKKAAAAGNQNQLTADGEEEAEGDEGAKYEEETDMGRQQSTSTRNLRLREDTAKYLLNLDLESAKYDPKTRSMVDAGPGDSADASEGFERASGDAAEFERAQRHAWEAQERGGGNNVHLQANPTAGEITRKREQEEAAAKKEAQKKALLERYGGQEHVQRNPLKDTAVTENERYVEYDERGRIRGLPEKKEKSMYAEDVLINNHTSVWGSWWRDFKWGYACCHSTVKNSFCTGEAGKQAFEEAEKFAKGTDLESSKNSVQVPKEIAWKTEGDEEEHVPNAVDRPEKARRDNVAESADRKRKLDEMKGGVTEEEMEEYRRKRTTANDPMANLLGKDELVD